MLPKLIFPDQNGSDSGEAEACSFIVTEQNWKQERSIAITPNSGTQLTGVQQSQVTTNLVLNARVFSDGAKSISVSPAYYFLVVIDYHKSSLTPKLMLLKKKKIL